MKMTKYLGVAAVAATLFTFTASANELNAAKQAIKLDIEKQLTQIRAEIDAPVNSESLTASISKASD